MPSKAPRLPVHLWLRQVRGALLVFHIALVGSTSASASEVVLSARFAEPTTRYTHGVLGDNIEYGELRIRVENKSSPEETFKLDLVYKPSIYTVSIRLPWDRVFEDIAPRLTDIDQDGSPEVIVVETQENTGAQLAIYNARGHKIAATPHIGTRFRWLAPIGAADLDGDGHVEIAYIDRPHLAKTLRIWRYADGDLQEVTSLTGLTNHRIGEDFITGGLRNCDAGPELVVVDSDWRNIIGVRFDKGWVQRTLAPFSSSAMKQVLNCSSGR